jgi:hypothetical protein
MTNTRYSRCNTFNTGCSQNIIRFLGGALHRRSKGDGSKPYLDVTIRVVSSTRANLSSSQMVPLWDLQISATDPECVLLAAASGVEEP